MEQIKILLVDDEEDFVKTLSDRMQIKNLDSDFVLSGEQALESLGTLIPDVMVLDLKMPGINGIEVLRRVKKSYPQVQVIILTGHGGEQEKRESSNLGAFDYFVKPVDIDDLIQSIKNAYEIKIAAHGKDNPGESAKFMTTSMKKNRSLSKDIASDLPEKISQNQVVNAFTEEDANGYAENALGKKPIEKTLGKLVVVGNDSEFTEEIIDYALEMARRMELEIVALNTAPLISKTFKVFTPPWKKVCEEFQSQSEENVKLFQQKVEENRIGFTHAVEFVEIDDALENLKIRFKDINLVISKPEVPENEAAVNLGEQPSKARKGFLVYAIS
jgi:CheY-like chemotaxis protein